jgi:predicted AlkP superfamily pyrophosphatase or phosphodiesterase
VKVLLVVIDAASPRVFCPAVQTGRLANLKRIADAGAMHQSSTSIFPSITPAATSSIITGCYPAEHGIAGAAWYDEDRDEVAYYGDDFWVIAREGFGAFIRDFLVRLNGDRLKAPTLFELVEDMSRRTASVNYLVHRGHFRHRVHIPKLIALLPGAPLTETVLGPSLLCLGDFVTPDGPRKPVKDRGGPMHRFGMDDASGAAMLCQLAEQQLLPDLTVAYFADNDYRSHEVGPHAALPVLDRVDAALGAMFDAAGGADAFLRDTCVVVTSDHGHCEILDDAERAVIRLDRLLDEFRQAQLGRPWLDTDDVLLCPNMRAAQIYIHRPETTFDAVVRAALADSRVDLALWHGRHTGGEGRYVAAGRGGRLEFWRGSDGREHAPDAFGTIWSWQGDRHVLRLEMQDGIIGSTDYPNAFERIAGGLDTPHSGELWLTAQPGCEFELPGGKAHVGGASHGALHALDSLSPVIVGGASAPALPRAMRSVDIAPLCMALLGMTMRYRVGDPRPAGAGSEAHRA